MKRLNGAERKYLRGLAHHLGLAVQIGIKGVTESLIGAVDDALDRHELIKVKFGGHKGEKDGLSGIIEERAVCERVGTIGNVVVFYRMHEDKDKRSILLPGRKPVSRQA